MKNITHLNMFLFSVGKSIWCFIKKTKKHGSILKMEEQRRGTGEEEQEK